ncbi:histidine phosphatase family protein [Diplocloster modestus]|uniref:Histidine phosphatase family protein n=1 Tax=Diplocloster modestus TaxID=2850322 RepID=A0ABS6K5W6_9FIRM|nr:histidine phosphatase family protein [Diplocloster modestus]MBU9725846.1 histidine phosphatase family protein [Diplocloster modestus]
MKVYIVRHGITEWNKVRRIQGHTDIPLSTEGIQLAQKTAHGMAGIPFTKAFSSPLSRAFHTAEIILQGRGISIETDERLAEINFGLYEGMRCIEPGRTVPPDFDNFFGDSAHYIPPAGGETLASVIRRGTGFLRELFLREDLQDDTILIAAHGCIIRGMLYYFREVPLAKFWGTGVPKNCAVSIAESAVPHPVLLEEDVLFYQNT